MLEYCYEILTKMSFDKDLFCKEFKKCLGYLTQKDAETLRMWAKENYAMLLQGAA